MRLAGVAAWLLLNAVAAAADFSASTVSVVPENPDAGDVVRYEIVLRNGGVAVPHASVSTEVSSALVLGMEGDCAGSWVDERWSIVDWIASGEKTCTIEALTFADDAGASAKLAADIRAGDQFWRLEAAPLLNTPRPAPQLVPGYIWPMLTAALPFHLIWAVWFAPPRARRGQGPVVAIALGLFFLLPFVDLALRDWRAAFFYVETDCVVMGATLDFETFRTATRSSRQSEMATPLLALRYRIDGATNHALGFAGPSHLLIGGGGGAVLLGYARGDIVPCRYDPEHDRTVLVRWEPGLAYLFALLPLGLLGLGAIGLRRPKSR